MGFILKNKSPQAKVKKVFISIETHTFQLKLLQYVSRISRILPKMAESELNQNNQYQLKSIDLKQIVPGKNKY